jgi:hypothetical protein
MQVLYVLGRAQLCSSLLHCNFGVGGGHHHLGRLSSHYPFKHQVMNPLFILSGLARQFIFFFFFFSILGELLHKAEDS